MEKDINQYISSIKVKNLASEEEFNRFGMCESLNVLGTYALIDSSIKPIIEN